MNPGNFFVSGKFKKADMKKIEETLAGTFGGGTFVADEDGGFTMEFKKRMDK